MPEKVLCVLSTERDPQVSVPGNSSYIAITDVTKWETPRAHTLFQRRTRNGCVWVYRYSARLNDALRAVIRDETAGEARRVWTLTILHSWGIALDPALYPFAAPWTRRVSRRRLAAKAKAAGV